MAALIQMCDEWYANMDKGKLNGVVFLDIRKAFDSINHNILLEKLETQFGISNNELKWFKSYLTNREQVCAINGHLSSPQNIVCGVPQGSILRPLLFLLYINDLPTSLKESTPFLYAADTQIFSSSYDYNELIDKLNSDLINISDWLARNKLQYHPTKTKFMIIGSTYNLNNKVHNKPVILNNKPVILNNKPLSRTSTFECLGVLLDEKLKWDKHIDKILKKVGSGIAMLRRAKKFIPTSSLQMIYNALIQPYFDCCSPLWDICGKHLLDKLQKFQNRAARIIAGLSYEINSADVLESLGWETLETRRQRMKSVFLYRIINDYTAPNLKQSLIGSNPMPSSYILRSIDTDIAFPKPRTEFLKKSFKYSGAKLWNSLSREAKEAQSIFIFKQNISR